MAKLLQLSILFAMIAIPTRAAREPNAVKGLKKALTHALYFYAFYLFILMFVYGRLS